MTIKRTQKLKTQQHLFTTYYATGEGSRPDFLMKMTDGKFTFIIERQKDDNGEFHHDVQVGPERLSKEILEFVDESENSLVETEK